jgi:parallel beta-helix repeat protein
VTEFTPKTWQNGAGGGTPISAGALIDLEARATAYADLLTLGVFHPKLFGAHGDGTHDDTAVIQGMLDQVAAAGGGYVYFTPGTYLCSQLSVDDNVHLAGLNADACVIKCNNGLDAGAAFIDCSNTTGVSIENLTIDGNNSANPAVGVYVTGNGSYKNFKLRGCVVKGFNSTSEGLPSVGQGCGVYVWTADGVTIDGNDFVDNNYDVFMDAPSETCSVTNNRIRGDGVTRLQAITLKRTTPDFSGSLVAGNSISGVTQDPSGIGQYGHGIQIVGCTDVRIEGNTVLSATCAGIHIGSGSYGAIVRGNTVRDIATGTAAGIYAELNIGDSLTEVGTDGRRVGCVIESNIVDTSGTYGIALSYSAGCIVRGNHISNTDHEAIITDSGSQIISGNTCVNCYSTFEAPDPTTAPNVRAIIRATAGSSQPSIFSDNQFLDTGSPRVTQAQYCVAVDSTRGHVIKGILPVISGVPGVNNHNDDGDNGWMYVEPTGAVPIISSSTHIDVLPEQRVVEVSGNVTISTIGPSFDGHVLTLVTALSGGTAQVDNTDNIVLATSPALGGANRTLTLVSYQNKWWEIGRKN